MRIAAVGDIHCTIRSDGKLQPLFRAMANDAELIILCGDLTDYGLPEEVEVLVHELACVPTTPKVAVLGNHDYESGHWEHVRDVLGRAGVNVLDGSACEIGGVGFAGVKGFGGGFAGHTLEAWGEPSIKHFVQEAANEEIKLEGALARLEDVPRVAVLHYAPIRDTILGESPEIYPFLGSVRLEEPLLRHAVEAVFHGHAHHGVAEGRTRNGTPVYNVAMPLLRRLHRDRPPFKTIEIRAVDAVDSWPVDRAEKTPA